MRIIATKTLVLMSENYSDIGGQIQAWAEEMEKEKFSTPNELKEKYKNASIINSKRVVFNIKGNDYRLVVDIEYKLKIVFIIWLGTHKEYDKLDIANLKYEKKNDEKA